MLALEIAVGIILAYVVLTDDSPPRTEWTFDWHKFFKASKEQIIVCGLLWGVIIVLVGAVVIGASRSSP